MEASCKAGNCGISEATYASLTSLGHSRAEVDCFLGEGQRRHNDGPGGPGGPNDHQGDPNQHMNQGDPNQHMNQGDPNQHMNQGGNPN